LSILPPTPPVFPAARHVVYPVHVCAHVPGSFSDQHPGLFAGRIAGSSRSFPHFIVSFTGTGSHE
jgi:hypothetical protein